MGVPGLYRWLSQRYPLVRQDMSNPSRPAFNNLYIDMNGILYRAVEIAKQKTLEASPEFLSEVFRYIDLLVQIARPTSLIYIAADGPPPAAKISQQRARRYVAAKDMGPNSFDRNTFTPGTDFMDQINVGLLKFFEEKRKSDSAWSTPTLIYSSIYTPGEGEHKILDYIRSNRIKPDWNPNQTHIVYSSDADVIFLSMQTHEPYFYILRENDLSGYQKPHESFESGKSKMKWDSDSFEMINIPILREYFSLDFHCVEEDLERTIDDFIAICFLIGDDFIPGFIDIRIQSGSLNDIIEVYKKCRKKNPAYLVENSEFNKDVLYEVLLGICRQMADNSSVAKIENEEQKKKMLYSKYTKYITSKYPEAAGPNFSKFVHDMSIAVLDSFHWVLKYYSSGIPSWTWFYPYHYTPPLIFILPTIKSYEPHFELNEPECPFVQQLLVLPPKSARILPDCLQQIMFPPSPVVDLFPKDFKTDLNGKKYEYEAVVLVTLIDPPRIRAEYEKYKDAISPEDMKRNTIRPALIYQGQDAPQEITIDKGSFFDPHNISTKAPVGVASILSINPTAEETVVPVRVFEYESQQPSILLHIHKTPMVRSILEAQCLLNQVVLFNWPYLRPGLVVGVADKSKTYAPEESATKSFVEKKIIQRLMSRYAIQCDNQSHIVFTILPLVASTIDESKFHYSQQSVDDLSELIFPVTESNITDRFQNISDEIQIGDQIVFTQGQNKGSSGRVSRCDTNEDFDVTMTTYGEPPLADILAKDPETWMSMDEVTKQLKINFKALKMALSSVRIKGKKFNMAFVLYSKNRQQVIEGCCKIINNQYFFPSSLLPVIRDYFRYGGNLKNILMAIAQQDSQQQQQSKFPGNPKTLGGNAKQQQQQQQNKQHFDFQIDIKDLYDGSPDEKAAQFDYWKEWLEQNAPASKYPLVNVETTFLSITTVQRLEEKLINFNAIKIDKPVNKCHQEDVIWAGKKNESDTTPVLPNIGQRVASIASSGAATFGAKGSVIAVDPSDRSITVLFDNELQCGTRLERKLTTNRGLVVHASDLIIL